MNNQHASSINILFITHSTDTSQFDLMIKKLSEITVGINENWKVFVLAGYPKNFHVELLNPFELHRVPIITSSKNIVMMFLYLILCTLKGVKLVREKNIHILMCYGGHMHLGLVAYIVSRLTNRKCIIRVSADFLLPLYFLLKDSGNFVFRRDFFLKMVALLYRRVENFLFKHFDWIVTHGPMDFEKIKKITNKISFVPLWIDKEKFRPLDEEFVMKFKRSISDDKDVKILLFVGRLHPEKDVKTLLRAFKMVIDTCVRFKFLLAIVGMGMSNYVEEYKETAIQLNIADRTRFLGYVAHEELVNYYNIADLYILPSLREEWSNTIMEAMACKVPVIATRVGANPYLVIEGKTGFLVPPKNPKKLTDKIIFTLENSQLAKEVSEKAFNEVKKYNKYEIGELHKSIIRNVINQKESY